MQVLARTRREWHLVVAAADGKGEGDVGILLWSLSFFSQYVSFVLELEDFALCFFYSLKNSFNYRLWTFWNKLKYQLLIAYSLLLALRYIELDIIKWGVGNIGNFEKSYWSFCLALLTNAFVLCHGLSWFVPWYMNLCHLVQHYWVRWDAYEDKDFQLHAL